MGKQEILKHLNEQLEFHRNQIAHMEREIEVIEEVIDQPLSPQAALQAQSQIERLRGEIVSQQDTISSIQEAIAKEEANDHKGQ
jgi:hypothetical protein